MRKILPVLFVSLITFFTIGCFKNNECKSKTPQQEQSAMLNYASANGITATAHSSGLYYQVVNPGSGATPTLNSRISVKYKGRLMNGTVFDSTSTSAVSFILGGVIPGWQLGIPLIQKGGSIKLLIPSSLAYGCQGSGPIPSNSVLYFDVDLIDVQ
jgi:FKBP-type peptidyl-prolyl cis-trans isomerase FkpA